MSRRGRNFSSRLTPRNVSEGVTLTSLSLFTSQCMKKSTILVRWLYRLTREREIETRKN